MYQLVIKNGFIIDGTGSPAFRADVAIEGGKIARIAKGLKGKQEIDATGLTVTPGFIDSHAHNDTLIFTFQNQAEKIEQGITTSIAGQCGSSHAPFGREVPPEKIPFSKTMDKGSLSESRRVQSFSKPQQTQRL